MHLPKRPVIIGITVVLCLILIVATASLVQSEFNKRSQLPAAAMQQAQTGVLYNADWQPLTGNFSFGFNMALVPAGCFMMGATDSQLKEATNSCEKFFGPNNCDLDFSIVEQPSHKVCIAKPFWINVTEITNTQYGSSSQISSEMYRGPDWPRDTVTWAEANDFCNQHGLRLPTEAEWEYAARGPDGLIYPWGNEFDPTDLTWGMLSPQDVGSSQRDRSWVGALDLGTSITEWVTDWFDTYPSQDQTDPLGPNEGQQRIARGGSWFSFAAFYARTTARYPYDPDYASSVVGFRCARDFD